MLFLPKYALIWKYALSAKTLLKLEGFLPKLIAILAEIEGYFCRNSFFLPKEPIMAERTSFCRKEKFFFRSTATQIEDS